jgi:amino acid adenylation domain-containing protein
VLRTTFPEVAGRPVQVIHAPWPFRLPLVDLRSLSGEAREREIRRLLVDEGQRRFDLSRDPLIRATALWTGESEHLLLQTEHHLVHDGWAQGVLLRDLLELYSAGRAGRSPELPPLQVQYADFAAWQREWLSGAVLEKQVAFWVRQLAGAPPLLELPTDRPRPAVLRSRGGEHLFDLSPALADQLRAFARRQGVTLFMVMLAVFQLLLHRLSGQTDVLVGSGVANRRRAETEGMIGMMVNTLVLRADLAGGPTLRELLLRVRQVCLQAYAHQDLPFDKLVEALRPERSLSYLPVIQTSFGFNDAPTPEWEVDGLRVEEVPTHNHSSKFDLLVIASPHAEQRTAFATRARGSGINLALEYNLDLFDSPTTLRFLHQYQTLLEDACRAPDRSIGELQWLLPAEIHQTRVEWNDAAAAYPREASLAELFAAVARARSDAPAVVGDDGEVWTYRRLDEASDRLAKRLRALGAGLEVAVGIALERSPELIAGILAVVKTGSAYVPLDPSYPDERLVFMLADAGVEIVLVDETTRGRLAGLEGKARLLSGAEGGAASPLDVPVPAAALGLVIYTSGSTGQPKGVALPQRGVVRLVRDSDFLQIGPGNRLGLASNISFDAATLEIWGALLNGATLVILPLEAVLSPADLASRLERHEIDTLHLTTALFNQMARERPDGLARLCTVMFGGEASDPLAVGRVLHASGACRLLHCYGPTESTTLASWHRVREVAPAAVTVPIGRPIANSQIHVLDDLLQPVPRGVVGELFVGGDGLSRGYLNRPDMTAESFIPHPWGLGDRLYRTGDRVRQLSDGAVEFVGRQDGQVKIRGFRIEPGEIEAVLASHPAVAEAVVAVQEAPGGRRLVAYAVSWEGAALEAGGLRQHLRRGLPDYMIPAAFVVLAALPLTPNGKVDRRALPAPEAEVSAEPAAAPRTLVEEILTGLWAELLGLPRVVAHDSFFELGGHSLLATQLASRLRGAFGVELPLRTLFERPTVAELAAAVEEARRGGEAAVPALVPVEREGELPLSFAQERLWFLDQIEPGSVAYSIPVAFRLRGPLDGPALAAALGEIVRRHEVLRTTFAAVNGRPIQRVAAPAPVAVPLVDLSGLPEAERSAESGSLAAAEAARPFDFARGPLLRLTLLRLAAAEHQALLNLHHIISDGWSTGVLVRELTALYSSILSGQGSPLPELPLQYADFALWQRRWLQGEILDSHLGYWRERLAGAPALLELRTDHPRPAVQSFRGAVRRAVLPPALTERLKQLSVREGCTLFMTLLTAFQVLLHAESGERDILVGSPISYRNWPEIEGLIGFFVNTLVYRLEITANPTFRELLGQTRERALEAFTYQHLPFDRLVEELRPERNLAYNPVSQVGFTFQSLGSAAPEMPGGLTLELVELDAGTTQFDLNLTLVDTPEGLLETLRYSRDLYEGVTIAWLQENLHALLEHVAGDPEIRMEELRRRLAALGESRWAAVGEELAQTRLPVPRGATRKRVTVDAPSSR